MSSMKQPNPHNVRVAKGIVALAMIVAAAAGYVAGLYHSHEQPVGTFEPGRYACGFIRVGGKYLTDSKHLNDDSTMIRVTDGERVLMLRREDIHACERLDE